MVRVGIIGTGGMAKGHARAYQKNREVELVACCDVKAEKLSLFAETWNIPVTYSDYREMISKEKLDGVSIVTPDSSHASISIDVLDSGVAVLCEKPMATSLAEAEQMLAAAEKSRLINMINYSKRNSSGLQEAARLVREGGLGRIMHVEASYLQSWLVTNDWGDWRTNPRNPHSSLETQL